MTSDDFAIVELDRQLASDAGGTQVQALQKTLIDASEQCRARLDDGVAPEEARRLNAMMAAYSAGLSLLPELWQAQQERK